jgi:hypothetical protein
MVYSLPERYGAASQSLDLLPEAAAGGQEALTSHQQQQKHSCPPPIHLLEVGGRQGRPEGPHSFLGCLIMAVIADLFKKKIFFFLSKGRFFEFFSFLCTISTLLLLPPLRFHCVGGCWDRTQDSCDYGIGCQTL